MKIIHGKKDFVKIKYLKILLDTNLKIILQDCRNNYIENLSIMHNITKNFNILTINLILHKSFDSPNIFSDVVKICIFRYFRKTVLSVYIHMYRINARWTFV